MTDGEAEIDTAPIDTAPMDPAPIDTAPMDTAPIDRAIGLGCGVIGSLGVGAKAANLDRASAAGLAVPPGFVLLDGARLGRGPFGERPLAVRSSFSAEDADEVSMAGRFHTELGVVPEPVAIEAAVERVRSSAADELETRRDVLVMEMVDADRAGVAFTQQQYEDDLVNAAMGLADGLVSGREAGDAIQLAKLRRWERPDPSLEPWRRRLSSLLRDVRRVFGHGDWDIEWADDGEVCWLVQVRPITAPPLRNEAFTIANHKEILPELPSVLMTSVIEAGSSELMQFWSSVDPSLPVHREFIVSFDGRPYLNLSMLTDLMRALGLPTRLVTDSYGGEPDVDIGARPLRTLAKTPTLLRIGRRQLGAERSAGRMAERIAMLGADRSVSSGAEGLDDSFAEALDDLRRQHVWLVNEMGALASSLAPPTAFLKRLGALDLHLSRHRSAATLMLDRLEPVRRALADGHAPGSPIHDRAWRSWIEHHGHRGVYESDVARPRFVDDPSPILASLEARPASVPGRASVPRRPFGKVVLRLATTPIWWAVRRAMVARENLRDQAMRGFLRTRRRLLALARAATADGRLPEVDAVWDLTRSELIDVDRGHRVSADFLSRRRAERVEAAERRLPDMLRRFDDVEAIVAGEEAARHGGRFRGLPLTTGRVSGVALRASEPPPELPEGFEPETTVLVARSVDAGWVPIFGHVAGVAVEIGGDLSHGSIVLRELGIPAITNMGDIGSSIATGDTVVLDAARGVLVVEEGD